jgi:hypothetical protein
MPIICDRRGAADPQTRVARSLGARSVHVPSRSWLLLATVGVLTSVLCGMPDARAQSSILSFGMSAPVYRGTRGAPYFPQENAFVRAALPQLHLNPVGKPCVEVFPLAEAQALNRNIYDHNLLMNNQCSETIRLSVCYYKTRTCSMFAIPGYRRELKVLGIFPEKDFRIEYREYLY